MSNVHQLNTTMNDEDPILEQASDWLTKIDRGLNKNEVNAFQEWIHISPEHMETLLEVAQMWEKMDDIARLTDLFPLTNTKQKKLPVWLGAVAASIFLGLSFSFLMPITGLDVFSASQPQVIVSSQFIYQTAIGESNTIQLSDHSKLVLNTNSLVQVNYSANARVIELKRGEIHIDVAHDKSRPLSVLAGGQVIQAVGTAFNVQLKAQQVELIVTQGIVLVKEKSVAAFNALIDTNATKLANNETSVLKDEKINLVLGIPPQAQVVKVDSLEIATKLSWRKGMLIFKGESLAEAIAEISRYTNVQFELEKNSNMAGIKVAGVFKTGDVAGLLNVLAKNFSISHEQISADKIRLTYQGS